MSLINQMLRDLEQHKALGASLAIEQSGVKVSVNAVEEKVRWLRGVFIITGGILLATGLITIVTNKPSETAQNIVMPLALPILQHTNRQHRPPLPVVPLPENIPELVKKVELRRKSATRQNISLLKPAKQHTIKINTPASSIQAMKKKRAVPSTIKKVTLSKTMLAEQTYQAAVKSTETKPAILLLQQAIKQEPKHLNARLLLTRLFIRAEEPQKAVNLLTESLSLFPAQASLVTARAQLYLQSKNAAAALQILASIAVPAKNEAYLALLAAAYQQNNNPEQASQHYQRLVSVYPEKSQYWLGLAVAQDAVGRPKQAYTAYQTALTLPGLNVAVIEYITQRIKKLTQRL